MIKGVTTSGGYHPNAENRVVPRKSEAKAVSAPAIGPYKKAR